LSRVSQPFELATRNEDDLLLLKELLEAGKVTPVIDRSYSLSAVPEAIAISKPDTPRAKSSSPCSGSK
jgi:hypothetical protein